MKRKNWWWFGCWFIGPMRYPRARIKYDLRCWLFGWECHFGSWRICIGPFEYERLSVWEVPQKADLKAIK